MAIAERRLAAEFNRPGHAVVDHWTYGICSDGDLQEGVASEAASLAGHLRLGKLVVLYDDNQIQLDGPTAMAWSEDVVERFDAYGWHTQRVADGNDTEAIAAAITAAREDDRPSLIAVRTHIGYGSPNRQDTQKAHGQPLGDDEVRLTKEAYGWDPDRDSTSRTRRASTSARRSRGRELVAEWEARWTPTPRAPRPRPPSCGDGWTAGCPTAGTPASRLPGRRGDRDPERQPGRDPGAGRALPELFGGAADLSESDLTDRQGRRRLRGRGGRPEPVVRRARARDGRLASTGSPTTAGSSRTSARS